MLGADFYAFLILILEPHFILHFSGVHYEDRAPEHFKPIALIR